MGKKALQEKRRTQRKIRATLLSDGERTLMIASATYEGSPQHKRNPGDFGLTPPSSPRPQKTLCDEAGIFRRADATALFKSAIDAGLVSEQQTGEGFPKQLWVVDDDGRVFELMYGGSRTGCYHGYPIRKSDPLFDQIRDAWSERNARA